MTATPPRRNGPIRGLVAASLILLFAVLPSRVDGLCRAAAAAGHRIQEVGHLVDKPEITLVYPDGSMSKEIPDGFDHFRG